MTQMLNNHVHLLIHQHVYYFFGFWITDLPALEPTLFFIGCGYELNFLTTPLHLKVTIIVYDRHLV